MQKIDFQYFTEFNGKPRPNSGASDLLIPFHLKGLIEQKIRKHGNLKNYFHFLIYKFHKKHLLSAFPDSAFRRTLYQSKNQNLIRYSFRPHHEDWYKAKIAGFYFGISICRLFARLIDLDKEEDSEQIDHNRIRRIHRGGFSYSKGILRPLHLHLTILNDPQMILKKLLLGRKFRSNTA
ncbi:DUF1564 family protein [Leptospira ellisii]|uniref:DUF1564 family protein n=1 Tax=Leptospira ellisii TaxID=2023197 RepID=A0A2N0BN05_9LEPT|nr:DUF1564 family protein [Leptospira ellisii]MDV6236776.1 DUF1564 family protein [Leptospira ellisii]PJZ90974.1 hypothetical protein CH379_21290 [Leptospira ellisii]PKA05361.1 hypothetical protein CH375_05655 [Leptospira ellisii]